MDSRFIIIYPAINAKRVKETEKWVNTLRSFGWDVHSVGVKCPGRWLNYFELEAYMGARHEYYYNFYLNLIESSREGDIFIADGGSMVPSLFLKSQRGKSVLLYADDPESTSALSKHIAPMFDLCLVSNSSFISTYWDWGCKKVDSFFHAIPDDLINVTSEDDFLARRSFDAAIFCEKNSIHSADRTKKLTVLRSRFKNSFVGGPGWEAGYVNTGDFIDIVKRSLVGWNFHLSIGPTNSRYFTYSALPALQICDNKSGYHPYMKDGEDIVMFDSLNECIDLTEYFIRRPDEAKKIAKNAWRNRHRFSVESQWSLIVDKIKGWGVA